MGFLVLRIWRLVVARGRGPPRKLCAYKIAGRCRHSPHLNYPARCMGAGIAAGSDEPDRARRWTNTMGWREDRAMVGRSCSMVRKSVEPLGREGNARHTGRSLARVAGRSL